MILRSAKRIIDLVNAASRNSEFTSNNEFRECVNMRETEIEVRIGVFRIIRHVHVMRRTTIQYSNYTSLLSYTRTSRIKDTMTVNTILSINTTSFLFIRVTLASSNTRINQRLILPWTHQQTYTFGSISLSCLREEISTRFGRKPSSYSTCLGLIT